jgi:hypothetical protein
MTFRQANFIPTSWFVVARLETALMSTTQSLSLRSCRPNRNAVMNVSSIPSIGTCRQFGTSFSWMPNAWRWCTISRWKKDGTGQCSWTPELSSIWLESASPSHWRTSIQVSYSACAVDPPLVRNKNPAIAGGAFRFKSEYEIAGVHYPCSTAENTAAAGKVRPLVLLQAIEITEPGSCA